MFENLIFLRRFAEVGLSIYMGNKGHGIFKKEDREVYQTGTYESPNWIIRMFMKSSEPDRINCNEYQCHARIVSPNKFFKQSQENVIDLDGLVSDETVDAGRRVSTLKIGRQ